MTRFWRSIAVECGSKRCSQRLFCLTPPPAYFSCNSVLFALDFCDIGTTYRAAETNPRRGLCSRPFSSASAIVHLDRLRSDISPLRRRHGESSCNRRRTTVSIARSDAKSNRRGLPEFVRSLGPHLAIHFRFVSSVARMEHGMLRRNGTQIAPSNCNRAVCSMFRQAALARW